jgi:hypothetical protein
MPHPRLQELLDHLDRHRAELRAAVETIPASVREQRPAPDRWSVAEVIEHLAIVETRSADRLLAKLTEARAQGIGRESETSPILPTIDSTALLNRSRKVSAPEVLHPSGLTAEAALAALEESRRRFRAALDAADGLALGTLMMKHPALGEMTLYQWIGALGGHEARHAAQIREIAEVLPGRA